MSEVPEVVVENCNGVTEENDSLNDDVDVANQNGDDGYVVLYENV